MADLRIIDAPEIPTNSITGQEKIPTGGSGNYSIALDSVADYTKTKKDLVDTITVDGKVNGIRQELNDHTQNLSNPHQVTKGQIGLGNVDNTADADKPVSNSAQAAIITAVAPKADKTYVDDQLTLKANKSDVYTKADTYTKQESSDLVNNSISTALTPVNVSLDLAKRGVINKYDSSLVYNSGERVVLTNGDIVKSTVDGNANNPNVSMVGWVKTNNASQIFDVSGISQQTVNDRLQSGRVYFSSFGAKTIEQVPDFDCTPIFLLAMYACAQAKKQLCINVSGTYRVNAPGVKSSLVGAVELTFDFNNLTVIGEGDIIIKAIGSNDDFFSMFKIIDAKSIEFQNITFDGNGSKYHSSTNQNQFENGYSAFNIRSNSDDAVDNILFYNCLFRNTGESAITSWGSGGLPLPHYFSNNINFVLCRFENIGAHGIGANEWRNSGVSQCEFKNVGMKRLVGVVGSGLAVDMSGGCEDCLVTGCNVDGAGGGFKAETHTYGAVDQAAKRISFLNNNIKKLWQSGRYENEDFSIYYGIRLNGVDCAADGNNIESYSHGIWFGGKAKDCSATNNTISSTLMQNSDGIYFENSEDKYGDNSANLNTIRNAKRNGINIQGARNSAANNKISLCGVGGIHVNYARYASVKSNECFNNVGYGVRVSKKTETASVVNNECYDTRASSEKTQTIGIQIASVFDEASNIQVQGNDSHDNKTSDYSMSEVNTYALTHFGYKEVYAGAAPLGGLWRNGDRVIQSFYGVGRQKGWVCSANGGATRGTLVLSSAVSVGQWFTWDSGNTAWEVTIAGTLAASSPDISNKVVGNTVQHGTATLTLRSLTTASFVSEGVY